MSSPAGNRAAAGAAATRDFFERQVRPVLAERCFACHGPKKQEAGLRLDSRASVLRGSENGPVAVAGHPEASRLVKAIGYPRYADNKGYKFFSSDELYAYTYRDWVIRAFNDDLPYDRFIVEQLAADRLLAGNDTRPLAAMGFLTVGRRFLEDVHDIADDRIDVVSRGLLGLTVSCARCHDQVDQALAPADRTFHHVPSIERREARWSPRRRREPPAVADEAAGSTWRRCATRCCRCRAASTRAGAGCPSTYFRNPSIDDGRCTASSTGRTCRAFSARSTRPRPTRIARAVMKRPCRSNRCF